MAKAKKLPSGMWRVQLYSHTELVDGKKKKVYKSFTAANKRAAELMAAEYKAGIIKVSPESLTVGEAIDRYIDSNQNVLSPTTTSNYRKIRELAFSELMSTPIGELTQERIQNAVRRESQRVTTKGKKISPKTVKNEYGLVSAALRTHGISFNVNLPKIPEKFVELPPADVVIAAVRGTNVELPALLACWLSFSMSEIRGLKCSSVRNGQIFVEQVLVTVDGHSVEKSTGKAEKRLRVHKIPPYIMQLVESSAPYQKYKETGEDGYLVPLRSNRIYERFQAAMKPTGYKMSFHQLRHLNASVMLALNIPERYAMERGGWKTPHTMKKVYEHTFSSERQKVDERIDSYFEDLISTTQNSDGSV